MSASTRWTLFALALAVVSIVARPYVGAQIAHRLGRVGAEHELAEVDDAHPGQRAGAVRVRLDLFAHCHAPVSSTTLMQSPWCWAAIASLIWSKGKVLIMRSNGSAPRR